MLVTNNHASLDHNRLQAAKTLCYTRHAHVLHKLHKPVQQVSTSAVCAFLHALASQRHLYADERGA